jgi:hypothetical protein
MLQALTGTWFATIVSRTMHFFSPTYLGEWRALKVRTAVSNFWPSLLEWMISAMSEDGQRRRCIADEVIGLAQLFQAQERDVGYLPHPGKAGVGGPVRDASVSRDCLAKRPRQWVNASMNRQCQSAKRRTLLRSVRDNRSKNK